MSLERHFVVGVVLVMSRGDSTPVPQWPGTRSPAGVREHGIRAYGYWGSSRNLGDPAISAEESAGKGPG